MSTETTPAAAAEHGLPDVDTARQLILNRVHKRAFVEKIAAIAPEMLPQNEAELNDLLTIGDREQAKAAEAAQKTASVSRFAGVVATLDGEVPGVVMKRANEQNVQRLRKIGAYLADDPAVYTAAAVLKTAEAQLLAEQEAAA